MFDTYYKIIGYFRRAVLVVLALALLIIKDYGICTAQVVYPQKVSGLTGVVDLVVGEDFVGAGQLETRPWTNPSNGLFLTSKPTTSWPAQTQLLKNTYPKNIIYKNQTLFVAASNSPNGGAYISNDHGKTFTHYGPYISSNSVELCNGVLYLGTSGHGLWVSNLSDLSNWNQVIGDGDFGPNINKLVCAGANVVATSDLKTYIRKESGNVFEEIPYLDGKKFGSASSIANNVILGTHNYTGAYISLDGGISWSKLGFTSNASVLDITALNNRFYMILHYEYPFQSRFIMGDGERWEIMFMEQRFTAGSLATYIDITPKLLFTDIFEGLFQMDIPTPTPEVNKFMELPWDLTNKNTFTEYISSYFDHEYPLIGYNLYTEPTITRSTTVNFDNYRGVEPNMYYSSHDGIDFKVPYGKNVKAVSGGTAEYYYCADCGNSIKISHPNGFQSIYMHLQASGLISNQIGEKIEVSQGQPIGRVGLTGNTTGPHIHLGIQTDINGNGTFSDDWPDNKVDPFGWLDPFNIDPWEYFTWDDSRGHHQGSKSIYLWNQNIPRLTKLLEDSQNRIILDNKTVITTDTNIGSWLLGPSLITKSVPAPLKYVLNTSVSIKLINLIGEYVKSLPSPVTLSIDLAGSEVFKYLQDSLKIFQYNQDSSTWEHLPSVLDITNSTISTDISYMTDFAVFGIPVKNKTLNTTASISSKNLIISLFDNDSSENTQVLYSLDGKESWESYIQPIPIDNYVNQTIYYTATDEDSNMGPINSITIPSLNSRKFKDKIIFLGVKITSRSN